MPRFNSEVRSVSGVTTCTGLPDSRTIQAFSCSGEVVTNRPCSETGIPSDAQRLITESGSPRNSAICFQPFKIPGWLLGFERVIEDLGTDH